MKCPECDSENPDDAESCASCGASLEEAREVRALIGSTIADRYRITRVIGIGGMGVVYEAEQQLGPHLRQVALKTLHPALARDEVVVSRFHRECGVVASLEHPNTIKFYDFGRTPDGMLYIVMELVRGEALTQLISRGAVPVERSLGILRQVCGALEEAHDRGIVHRDLKPDNIILTRQDFVKLLDFGIAARVGAGTKAETKLTQQGTVLGTPPYMSPEQFMGKELDRRSDVYALGVIAYEMMSARLPFSADTPFEWAVRHMTAPPEPPPSTLPSGIRDALMRALEKEPAARPQTAMAFFNALESGASGVMVLGRESTLPESRRMTTEDRQVVGVRGPGATPLAIGQPGAAVPVSETGKTQPVGIWAPAMSSPMTATGSVPAMPTEPVARRRVWPMMIALVAVGAAATAGVAMWQRRSHHRRDLVPSAASTPSAVASLQIGPEIDAGFTDPFAPTETSTTPAAPPGPRRPAPTAAQSAPPPSGFPFPFPIPTFFPPPTTPSGTAPPPPTAPTPPPTVPPQPTTPPPPSTTPAPTPSPPAPPQPAPPKPAPSSGDVACHEADAAARAKNISGAVAAYRRCSATSTDAHLKSTTLERIRLQAAVAARERAYIGDCSGARAIVQEASSIGAGNKAAAAVATTQCK